jgi:hypothetical protein
MGLSTNSGALQTTIPDMHSRAASAQPLSMHRLLPVAAFYFFFNCAGLPLGLFFTSVFSPLLYLWLYLKGERWVTAKFLLVLSPFMLAHLLLGVSSPIYYLRTLALLWTVYVAAYAICWALSRAANVDRLFCELVVLNFCGAMFAVAIFPTPLRLLLWRDDAMAIVGASHLYRLNLFSIEPSGYALLMLPLLMFASLRLMRYGGTINFIYLSMIVVPFLLCQSFGGISMGLAGVCVVVAGSYRRFLRRPIALIALMSFAAAVGLLLFTHNPISERIVQVANGGDSSTQSRTIFSFVAAYAVASVKSIWWGAGLGQTKLTDFTTLGIGFTANIIPNAIAATFAELGIIGVVLKVAVEFYLFFRARVYVNSFRLAMFTITFIAQFTGSFLTNIQEYVMWCFAIYPFFPDLDFSRDPKSQGRLS